MIRRLSRPPLFRFFSKYRDIGIRRRNAPLPLIPSLKGRGEEHVPSPSGLARLWRERVRVRVAPLGKIPVFSAQFDIEIKKPGKKIFFLPGFSFHI